MSPASVKVVEVGARDGLQNETRNLSIAIRAELVDRLSNCGFSTIEAGSLVSSAAVPQMSQSEKVYQSIHRKTGVEYPLLVGNEKGLNRAISAGVRQIAVFCAPTETFSRKNNHCSVQQTLDRIIAICEVAVANQIRVRAYVSCSLGCPYEGVVKEKTVANLAARLIDFGCYEVSLADTIGLGTPGSVNHLLETVGRYVSLDKLAVHFHDTYGQALANSLVAIQAGIRVIDSSIAGLGGCPFAGNVSGNLASEDLVYMLNGLGIQSGIDLNQLVETSWYIANILGRQPYSRVSRAMGRPTRNFPRHPGSNFPNVLYSTK